jgi:hypothetical protein
MFRIIKITAQILELNSLGDFGVDGNILKYTIKKCKG